MQGLKKGGERGRSFGHSQGEVRVIEDTEGMSKRWGKPCIPMEGSQTNKKGTGSVRNKYAGLPASRIERTNLKDNGGRGSGLPRLFTRQIVGKTQKKKN